MSCASYAAWTKGVKIRSASAGGHGRFVAASAQARQDGRLISASADESSEYICGSGGTAQAEGQGYSERGVLVAWRARTGHEATGRVVGERECRPAPEVEWRPSRICWRMRKRRARAAPKCGANARGDARQAIDGTIPEGIGELSCSAKSVSADGGTDTHHSVRREWRARALTRSTECAGPPGVTDGRSGRHTKVARNQGQEPETSKQRVRAPRAIDNSATPPALAEHFHQAAIFNLAWPFQTNVPSLRSRLTRALALQGGKGYMVNYIDIRLGKSGQIWKGMLAGLRAMSEISIQYRKERADITVLGTSVDRLDRLSVRAISTDRSSADRFAHHYPWESDPPLSVVCCLNARTLTEAQRVSTGHPSSARMWPEVQNFHHNVDLPRDSFGLWDRGPNGHSEDASNADVPRELNRTSNTMFTHQTCNVQVNGMAERRPPGCKPHFMVSWHKRLALDKRPEGLEYHKFSGLTGSTENHDAPQRMNRRLIYLEPMGSSLPTAGYYVDNLLLTCANTDRSHRSLPGGGKLNSFNVFILGGQFGLAASANNGNGAFVCLQRWKQHSRQAKVTQQI
ncbi:hypothetical protein B0H13DRAFT_1889976 [Mycena leptocephala]|nr:hypothetical protein B0H13DRAFT_1889976 [Mycena leptocephala]